MGVRRPRAAGCALLAAAVGAAGLAAAATAAAPATRNMTATGKKLAFSRSSLSAPAGSVKLVLTNNSGTFRHNVSVKGNGIKVRKGKVVRKGGVSTVTVRLAPGRYTYFCSVGSHAKNGMRGTLAVR